jgi:hypothetical protein
MLTPLSIAAVLLSRGLMHWFRFFEVFSGSLRDADHYKLDASKLKLIPNARNRRGIEAEGENDWT